MLYNDMLYTGEIIECIQHKPAWSRASVIIFTYLYVNTRIYTMIHIFLYIYTYYMNI
jgi:hypothetical protein